MSRNVPMAWRAFSSILSVAMLLLAAPAGLSAQANAAAARGAMDGPEITWQQFREEYGKHQAAATPAGKRKSPPGSAQVAPQAGPFVGDVAPAAAAFLRVLEAQARIAAARQSQDRLAGWSKAVATRHQAQSVATIDVEQIRFAELRIAAEIARYESELRQAINVAGGLIGRPAGGNWVAVASPPAGSGPGSEDRSADPGLDQMAKEVLPRGQELLAKFYQSYTFGGAGLGDLLWQEREVYRTELDYRVWSARASMGQR